MPRSKYVTRPVGLLNCEVLETEFRACPMGVLVFGEIFPNGTPATHKEALARLRATLGGPVRSGFWSIGWTGNSVWLLIDWLAYRVDWSANRDLVGIVGRARSETVEASERGRFGIVPASVRRRGAYAAARALVDWFYSANAQLSDILRRP